MLKIAKTVRSTPLLSARLLTGLQDIQRRSEEFELSRASQVGKIDALYQDTISHLHPRIMVRGEQSHLLNEDTAARIRTLLLAGIGFLALVVRQSRALAREAEESERLVEFLADFIATDVANLLPMMEGALDNIRAEYVDEPVLQARLLAKLTPRSHRIGDHEVLQQTLDFAREQLGPEHPDTLAFQHWFAAGRLVIRASRLRISLAFFNSFFRISADP